MKYDIFYEKDAEQDLIGAIRYISKELCNPTAARNLHMNVIKTVKSIAEFPFSAPLSKYAKLQINGVRQITVNNFCIFYYPDENAKRIVILYIKFAKMDFSNLI